MTRTEDKKTNTITFTPDQAPYLAFFGVGAILFSLTIIERMLFDPNNQGIFWTTAIIALCGVGAWAVTKQTYIRMDDHKVYTRLLYGFAINIMPLDEITRLEIHHGQFGMFGGYSLIFHRGKKWNEIPLTFFEDKNVSMEIIDELERRSSHIMLDESVRAYMKKLSEKKSKKASPPNTPQGT